MWTTTVVSQSEQGIILPVVCDDIKDSQDSNDPIDSNGEDSPNSLQATGVAVVPLRSSGLTYTEYTGPNAQ
jgi:hypothetical protein